jgi:YggT family protein
MSSAPYLNNASVFLIQTAFGFYILVVMLRFLLQWARADFYNPLVQFLVKLSNPLLIPLRRVIPSLMGLDMAAVVLMLALQVVELLLLLLISGQSANFVGLLVLAVGKLLGVLINVLFWAVIIQAILSWVNPDPRNPAISLLYQLTEPVVRPARRLLPPISGLDLSPILVLVALQLLKLLLVAPLEDIGFTML